MGFTHYHLSPQGAGKIIAERGKIIKTKKIGPPESDPTDISVHSGNQPFAVLKVTVTLVFPSSDTSLSTLELSAFLTRRL